MRDHVLGTILTAILTPLLAAACYALLARAIPARPRTAEPPRFDERELARAYSLHTLAVLAFAAAAAFMIFQLLEWAGARVFAPGGADEVVWSPRGAVWWLPAIFLGILAGAALAGALLRMRDESLAEAIEDYESRQHGVDFRRIGPAFVTAILLGGGLFIALAMGWSMRFGPDAIVEDPFLPGRTLTHRYADVRHVVLSPVKTRDRILPGRLALEIRFADGHVLRSAYAPRDVGAGELAALARRVADRAGVAIERAGAPR